MRSLQFVVETGLGGTNKANSLTGSISPDMEPMPHAYRNICVPHQEMGNEGKSPTKDLRGDNDYSIHAFSWAEAQALF